MINKTTVLAIRALIHLGRQTTKAVRTPRSIAEELGESPTYLAKVTRQLVKAGILRAEKGVRGGVYLAKPPLEVSLLDIVEACQGALTGDYCQQGCHNRVVCSYHAAAEELLKATVGVLSKWTLAKLMEKPSSPKMARIAGLACLMTGGQAASRLQ
ncbi:MAG: Rrf2 family transcriptional regulator [Acidobacteria bacterium]|nr:Rrf2 family transcriptional regulator [Acidobacteriota bacterium]